MWSAPRLMPTPRSALYRDGSAELLHFTGARAPAVRLPLLIVPSLINRWYVVDLRPGASLVGALVDAGLDVYCLDWGVPDDEHRHLTWDDLVDRLLRAMRRIQ